MRNKTNLQLIVIASAIEAAIGTVDNVYQTISGLLGSESLLRQADGLGWSHLRKVDDMKLALQGMLERVAKELGE